MSTKYILPTGRDAVHAALLDPVKAAVTAMLFASEPKLILDIAMLNSKTTQIAVPLVDQLVAVLEGNAENSVQVLLDSVNRETKLHEERMRADSAKMLHEIVDAIFADPSKMFGQNSGPETATDDAKGAVKRGNTEEARKRLAAMLGIDPNDIRKAG